MVLLVLDMVGTFAFALDGALTALRVGLRLRPARAHAAGRAAPGAG